MMATPRGNSVKHRFFFKKTQTNTTITSTSPSREDKTQFSSKSMPKPIYDKLTTKFNKFTNQFLKRGKGGLKMETEISKNYTSQAKQAPIDLAIPQSRFPNFVKKRRKSLRRKSIILKERKKNGSISELSSGGGSVVFSSNSSIFSNKGKKRKMSKGRSQGGRRRGESRFGKLDRKRMRRLSRYGITPGKSRFQKSFLSQQKNKDFEQISEIPELWDRYYGIIKKNEHVFSEINKWARDNNPMSLQKMGQTRYYENIFQKIIEEIHNKFGEKLKSLKKKRMEQKLQLQKLNHKRSTSLPSTRVRTTFYLDDLRTDKFMPQEIKQLIENPSKKIKDSNLYDFIYNRFKEKKEEIKLEINQERQRDVKEKMKEKMKYYNKYVKMSNNVLKRLKQEIVQNMRRGNHLAANQSQFGTNASSFGLNDSMAGSNFFMSRSKRFSPNKQNRNKNSRFGNRNNRSGRFFGGRRGGDSSLDPKQSEDERKYESIFNINRNNSPGISIPSTYKITNQDFVSQTDLEVFSVMNSEIMSIYEGLNVRGPRQQPPSGPQNPSSKPDGPDRSIRTGDRSSQQKSSHKSTSIKKQSTIRSQAGNDSTITTKDPNTQLPSINPIKPMKKLKKIIVDENVPGFGRGFKAGSNLASIGAKINDKFYGRRTKMKHQLIDLKEYIISESDSEDSKNSHKEGRISRKAGLFQPKFGRNKNNSPMGAPRPGLSHRDSTTTLFAESVLGGDPMMNRTSSGLSGILNLRNTISLNAKAIQEKIKHSNELKKERENAIRFRRPSFKRNQTLAESINPDEDNPQRMTEVKPQRKSFTRLKTHSVTKTSFDSSDFSSRIKNSAYSVQSNMRRYRYKLMRITTDINKLENEYRIFKKRQDNNIEQMSFLMDRLVRTEQNADLDQYLDDYLKKEIKRNDVQFDARQMKKITRLNKTVDSYLIYSGKDNSIYYKT